ncbi:MAG TPA: hypothetical protein ENH11_07445 [Candidatus Acetothermia bacterium]|nr:hypothetical protein [Candidatus Acetothermia bacterium]
MNRWRLVALGVLLFAVAGVGGCFLFPNHPPVASFTVSRGVDLSNPNDQLVVILDASGSTDPDGDDIVSYMWALEEDGVTVIAPQGTTMTVSNSILTVKYPVETTPSKVELVVVDSKGAMSDPVSQTITVPVPE